MTIEEFAAGKSLTGPEPVCNCFTGQATVSSAQEKKRNCCLSRTGHSSSYMMYVCAFVSVIVFNSNSP